jgi:PEGA domain
VKVLVLCLGIVALGDQAQTQIRQIAIPSDPGMYVATSNGTIKILGQITEFHRTGSRLVSGLTVGIKTAKVNVQLLGAHAQTVVDGEPSFYFITTRQQTEVGLNAGDLILIRLEEKPERRQFEIGAEGAWRASSGISITHQIQLFRDEVKPGAYKIAPAIQLERGEYALYLARGGGMSPYVYDFSVQALASRPKAAEAPDAYNPRADVAVRVAAPPPPAPSRDIDTASAETPVMIDLASDPAGAEINIDDSFIGKAPMTTKIEPGKHAIRMFMSGYQNWLQWITIKPGADVHVAATLTKLNE